MRGIPIALFVLSLALPLPGSARDYTPKDCPVVGNTNSKIYHVPGGVNYRRMLQENKKPSRDNRECFPNEEAARKAGYRKSKT